MNSFIYFDTFFPSVFLIYLSGALDVRCWPSHTYLLIFLSSLFFVFCFLIVCLFYLTRFSTLSCGHWFHFSVLLSLCSFLRAVFGPLDCFFSFLFFNSITFLVDSVSPHLSGDINSNLLEIVISSAKFVLQVAFFSFLFVRVCLSW